MVNERDIASLLAAYCEGLYAMDPRTTFPFWDYDFAPLFSKEWIAKIATATANPKCRDLSLRDCLSLFHGPSVPRKELLYSLVDMKVAGLSRPERMRLTEYWIGILRTLCGDDWLSDGSNRMPIGDNIPVLLAADGWVQVDSGQGRSIGGLIAALHAFAYGLYSDVFVHQCAETRGPYDVSEYFGSDRPYTLLIRSWVGLRPLELWPGLVNPLLDQISIAAIYDSINFHIDVYNHTSWRGNAPWKMRAYRICRDGDSTAVDPLTVAELAAKVATIANQQHQAYVSLGFEGHKRLWIRQRNYQFRLFFSRAGLKWDAPEMEDAVAGVPLRRDPFWDMRLPKEPLFRFLSRILDPRDHRSYAEWSSLFQEIFDTDKKGKR